MNLNKAKKLAQVLVEAFGDVEQAHRGYQRAMQNNCSFHDFKKLLGENE